VCRRCLSRANSATCRNFLPSFRRKPESLPIVLWIKLEPSLRRDDEEMAMSSRPRIEINGEPASADDLRHLVQTNYGHFTAMRVENGGVRGLDLHLDRLDAATHELFGTTLDLQRMRGYLRHAIADARDLSL